MLYDNVWDTSNNTNQLADNQGNLNNDRVATFLHYIAVSPNLSLQHSLQEPCLQTWDDDHSQGELVGGRNYFYL